MKAGGTTRSGYLDTVLVSGIRKQDLGAEQGPLRQILLARKRGGLRLVTSSITQEEMQKLPGGIREAHEEIYALLADVPTVDEESLFPRPVTNRGGSRVVGPTVVKDPLLGELEALLPDREDARHIFQAIKDHVDYFITNDRRTILRFATELESRFGIKACRPSELLAELGL